MAVQDANRYTQDDVQATPGLWGGMYQLAIPWFRPGFMGVEALQASRMKGVSFGVRIFIGPIGIEN